MQDVTVNYVNAATGAGGVWADPELFADWLNDGIVEADGQPLAIVDLFGRKVVDGWGITDTGQSWQFTGGGTIADTDVDGTYGTMSINGTNTFRLCYINPAVLSIRNVDIRVACLCPVPTGAEFEACTVYFRYNPTTSDYYQLRTVINTDATVTIAIFKSLLSVETLVVSPTVIPGLIHQADQELTMRCKIVGTSISIKVWRSGTAEPPQWQLTATDSNITNPGTVGVRSAIYTGNTNVKPVTFNYNSVRAINGMIDDLTHQQGSWSVTHHLDDGYPDSVTFISGVGTPELTAELGPAPVYQTGLPMQTAEYFSPYNELSPVFGLDRDVAAVTLDHGVVGTAGPERVRVFTGQMSDIPVKRGAATLAAVSATRLKLAKLVQPPSVNGIYQGANATWPISYALAACGVYGSPPPQSGCRYWAPQHGSIRAFIPGENLENTDMMVSVGNSTGSGLGPSRLGPIRVVDGPFVSALEYGVNAEFWQRGTRNPAIAAGVPLAAGADLCSATGKGKFEMWVRGDTVNVNSAPGGSGSVVILNQFYIDNVDGSGLEAWLNPATRKLHMFMKDGVNSGSIISDAVLPTDGAWHFIGWSWDIANKTGWVNIDGTVKTGTVASLVPILFPDTDDFAPASPRFVFTLPTAEVQVTAGVTPNTSSWLMDIPFTAQARVTTSVMELANVAETEPKEAWAYLASFAQAELASMRTDELDVFEYLGFGWWVRDAQQVVAEIYSTEFNAGTVDINIDPTKIRNEIAVSFDEVISVNSFVNVFSSQEPFKIPPGMSTLTVPLSKAAFELRGFAFTNIVAATVTQPMNVNSVSFNAASDGSSTYFASSSITAEVLEWDPGSVTILFNNNTGQALFTANDKSWPAITVAAKSQEGGQATVVDSNDLSISIRGERSLPINASAAQTRVNARRLARRLKMALRDPQPAAEELTLFGEARRQPGDLVQFQDPSLTKVSGLWRVQQVAHEYSVRDREIEYTNNVIVRPTRSICVVGTGRIGQTLVGPEE